MRSEVQNKIRSFTDLVVWQRAHAMTLAIYAAVKSFPVSERFALSSQLRRATVSIQSNIAEGFNRMSKADKAHFYQMALGSCAEVENQLYIARDLSFLQKDTADKLIEASYEVHRLINGLIKSTKGIS